MIRGVVHGKAVLRIFRKYGTDSTDGGKVCKKWGRDVLGRYACDG